MRLIPTDPTAKRLLIRSIGSVYMMAPATLLRRIGTLHSSRLYASFGRIPCDLLSDVCQVRCTHIGIHGSRFVLHRGNRKLFIGKVCIGMLSEALVDRPIDLLPHMPGEALPASAAGGSRAASLAELASIKRIWVTALVIRCGVSCLWERWRCFIVPSPGREGTGKVFVD